MSRFSKMRPGWSWLAGAGAAAGLLALAAPAASAAPHVPAWKVVKTVKAGDFGQFSALAATGQKTGWAFTWAGLDTAKPGAWQEKNGSWVKGSFPGLTGEEVIAAGAASPASVWAFTRTASGGSRVLRWNGSAWSVVKTFTRQISTATVVSARNVWVYGEAAEPGQPALGTWFFNGTKWSQVSKSLQGGSALSDKDVWAFNGTAVDHWNGAKWTATSVNALLPARNPGGLNNPSVVGILAVSKDSVYALGNGNAQDEGGPLVVLHYNGSTWSKVASGEYGYGPDAQFSTDGKGGLWLPMDGPVGGTSFLLHYSGGKLTKAVLPVSAATITLGAVARVPGSAAQLAGGFTHAAGDRGKNVTAVLLEFA